jgi:hypothetical protein
MAGDQRAVGHLHILAPLEIGAGDVAAGRIDRVGEFLAALPVVDQRLAQGGIGDALQQKNRRLRPHDDRRRRVMQLRGNRRHGLGRRFGQDCRQAAGGIDDKGKRLAIPEGAGEFALGVDDPRDRHSLPLRRRRLGHDMQKHFAAGEDLGIAGSQDRVGWCAQPIGARLSRASRIIAVEQAARELRQDDPRHQIADVEDHRRHPYLSCRAGSAAMACCAAR